MTTTPTCPTCGSSAKRCKRPSGHEATEWHAARRKLAAKAAEPQLPEATDGALFGAPADITESYTWHDAKAAPRYHGGEPDETRCASCGVQATQPIEREGSRTSWKDPEVTETWTYWVRHHWALTLRRGWPEWIPSGDPAVPATYEYHREEAHLCAPCAWQYQVGRKLQREEREQLRWSLSKA